MYSRYNRKIKQESEPEQQKVEQDDPQPTSDTYKNKDVIDKILSDENIQNYYEQRDHIAKITNVSNVQQQRK